MELVFIYIDGSAADFIQNKGFNFSSNYNFYVDIVDDKYILKQNHCKMKLPADFFDSSYCITNVTAVVGENGSGKTTLLNYLAKERSEVRNVTRYLEYKDYYDDEYEKGRYIAIYLEGENLICYHNINALLNQTKIKDIISVHDGSDELAEIVHKNTGFINISKIYLTNSMYPAWNGISNGRKGKINQINLNANSLNVLKDMFYEKKCKKNYGNVGEYCLYQDNFIRFRKANNFQQILDVIYLHYIKKERIHSIFSSNLASDLSVRFLPFTKCVDKSFWYYETEDKGKHPFKQCRDIVEKVTAGMNAELCMKDVFCNLYINLLYEMYLNLVNVRDEYKDVIGDKQALSGRIKRIIHDHAAMGDRNAGFFQSALDEIEEYEKCLESCSLFYVSENPCIARKEIKFESSVYYDFLRLVKKSALEREHTFVLKYIEIGGLRLASGERALLNFFSWLHLVPFFHCINSHAEESLYDNILMLIDEIDLYCHPLWQQKILNYLMKETKILFPDKKVQIIFSTHSPIVLSDMPQNNVIYLRNRGGKCEICEGMQETKTFGANIYKLFNDAFFLGEKGQIGEFAKNKIQKIIDAVKQKKDDDGRWYYPRLQQEEADRLKEEISLIGEDIIRDKLYEMLYKCLYGESDLRERKIRIYEEKLERLRRGEDS